MASRNEVDPHDARAARAAALDTLSRRDHASRELERKLLDKGYDGNVVGPVIDQLKTEKLVDDGRFVENFIGYHAARGQGPMRVRAELRQLGLSGELVEAQLDAYPNWLIELTKARIKKFGAALPADFSGRQRQLRFLSYRGFTGTQIRMALGFDTDIDSTSYDL